MSRRATYISPRRMYIFDRRAILTVILAVEALLATLLVLVEVR